MTKKSIITLSKDKSWEKKIISDKDWLDYITPKDLDQYEPVTTTIKVNKEKVMSKKGIITLSIITVLAGITFWLWYYSELYRIFL